MFNFKKKEIAEDAKLIIDIVNNFSGDSSIKKLVSPISEDYFLLDEKNQVAICIADGEITFSNHVYMYKNTFNLSFTDGLKKKIKQQMEKEMQELKAQLFRNEVNLLDKINGLSAKEKTPIILRPNFKSS